MYVSRRRTTISREASARPATTGRRWAVRAAVAAVTLGAVSATLPAAHAAPDPGITNFALYWFDPVDVGPGGQSRNVKVIVNATLPSSSSTVDGITVTGVRQPDSWSSATGVTMRFKQVCRKTATCWYDASPAEVEVRFILKPIGVFDTARGKNAVTALTYPGTYSFLPTLTTSTGVPLPYTGSAVAVRFVRATDVPRFAAVRTTRGATHRTTVLGKVTKAVPCTKGSKAVGCRNGQIGRWVAAKGRAVELWFNPTGAAPAYLVTTVTTGMKHGCFSASLTQKVPGVWRAKVPAVSVYGATVSVKDRVR